MQNPEIAPAGAQRIVVIGGGGHARSVADTVLSGLGTAGELAGFVSQEPIGTHVVAGHDVIGCDADLPSLITKHRLTHFIVGIGSTRGGTTLRALVFDKVLRAGLAPYTAIHPGAIVSAYAEIGPGSVVMAGATVNAGAQVGRNVIVNTGAVIDHDASIGDHAHIAPGATLSGEVKIGENALVGVGATVIQGVKIGTDATVAAGAVVLKDVPNGRVVMGTPARITGSEI